MASVEKSAVIQIIVSLVWNVLFFSDCFQDLLSLFFSNLIMMYLGMNFFEFNLLGLLSFVNLKDYVFHKSWKFSDIISLSTFPAPPFFSSSGILMTPVLDLLILFHRYLRLYTFNIFSSLFKLYNFSWSSFKFIDTRSVFLKLYEAHPVEE